MSGHAGEPPTEWIAAGSVPYQPVARRKQWAQQCRSAAACGEDLAVERRLKAPEYIDGVGERLRAVALVQIREVVADEKIVPCRAEGQRHQAEHRDETAEPCP